jgi:hypothetical protein
MWDGENIISCITICAECGKVYGPVPADDPDKIVEYVPIKVDPACVAAVTKNAIPYHDKRFKCVCGSVSIRNPSHNVAKKLFRERFLQKVRD